MKPETIVKLARAVEAVRGGSKRGEAAKRFRVRRQYLENACRDAGLIDITGPPPSMRTFVVIRRLLDGDRQCDVAADLNLSRPRVNTIARKMVEADLFAFKRGGR